MNKRNLINSKLDQIENIKGYGSSYPDNKYEQSFKNSKDNYKYQGSGTLENKPEHDTRKLIERELNPYVDSVKKSIALTMDNFLFEIGDYKLIKEDILILKSYMSKEKNSSNFQLKDQELRLNKLEINLKQTNKILEEYKRAVVEQSSKIVQLDSKLSNNVSCKVEREYSKIL